MDLPPFLAAGGGGGAPRTRIVNSLSLMFDMLGRWRVGIMLMLVMLLVVGSRGSCVIHRGVRCLGTYINVDNIGGLAPY